MEECHAYCLEKGDSFYFDAFLFEAWIGAIIAKTVNVYATNKSGSRHLQTGLGWAEWEAVFGHTKPEDWLCILQSLARFANCDTPEGEMTAEVWAIMSLEDKHAEAVNLSAFLEKAGSKMPTEGEIIGRMRYTFQRMAEWMEALVHWQVHVAANATPLAFGATEEKRELANIGLMQAGFASLNAHGKEWWHFRHEELARQFTGQPDWRLVGKAQSLEKFGELRQPEVDELTVHWWPLLTRYRWTDHDMRCLLMRVVSHPNAYPLREDKEFADYRQKALGLIKGKKKQDKSAPDGLPMGWRAALAMIGKLPD